MSSRGYLCIAQNSGKVNYLEQAYALALSLKLSQSIVSKLSVCVDSQTKLLITEKHKRVFDQIIDIPWGDHAVNDAWKIQNKWKYFWMTPYEETVILDADMIFPADISHWWPIMASRDAWITTTTKTYRGHDVSSDFYRKAFSANDLPNVYTAFFYFKKSTLAADLFKVTEVIFQHWERMFNDFVPLKKPSCLSGDVAFALAIKLLSIESEVTCNNITNVPTFTHMKSHIQGVPDTLLNTEWNKSLPTYWENSRNFKVGNFQQRFPFHYVEPSWLQKEWISSMETELGI